MCTYGGACVSVSKFPANFASHNLALSHLASRDLCSKWSRNMFWPNLVKTISSLLLCVSQLIIVKFGYCNHGYCEESLIGIIF